MSNEAAYLDIILSRIRICRQYRPKFGQGQRRGMGYQEFQRLYADDLLYHWLGLDHPLMYAAHKAAGGLTSIYRQIGTACEALVVQIFRDQYQLSGDQVAWAYTVLSADGRSRQLHLDARLSKTDLAQAQAEQLNGWLEQAAQRLQVDQQISAALQGAVFEIRQGYKSKDSKRQNADLANAASAYSRRFLPVALLLSSQMDSSVMERYQHEHWLVLLGNLDSDPTLSTYTFMREVVGYDLASFFHRHAALIQSEIHGVLEALLRADE